MRKLLIFAGLALTVSLLVFFIQCDGNKNSNSVKIGAVLPLTGSAAQWGGPARDAALMAVEEVNSKGGIKGKNIILEVEDDKCDPTTGVSAIQKILATSK